MRKIYPHRSQLLHWFPQREPKLAAASHRAVGNEKV
jgi:hypothetical protein